MNMEISENMVKVAIAAMLERSLNRIRALVHHADSRAIEIEANHVRNLPAMLVKPLHLPALKYYWENERVEYIAKCDPDAQQWYKEDWKLIDAYLRQQKAQPVPSPQ
jgi:hypothetical protein